MYRSLDLKTDRLEASVHWLETGKDDPVEQLWRGLSLTTAAWCFTLVQCRLHGRCFRATGDRAQPQGIAARRTAVIVLQSGNDSVAIQLIGSPLHRFLRSCG